MENRLGGAQDSSERQVVGVELYLLAHNELVKILFSEDHSKYFVVQLQVVSLRRSRRPQSKPKRSLTPTSGFVPKNYLDADR